MKQSQRHTGRARERPPGRGVRSITIFAVALIAAAASLLSFENQHTANEVAASLPVDCERYSMSRSECRPSRTGLPATALNDILHGQEQPVTDAPRLEQDRSPRRAWQQPEQVAKLRPGYTLVELCSHSPDLAVTYCDAHSTNDLYSLTGAGGIMDDLEGPYISGRVISAQGETLEGVSIVALPERLEDDTITLSENLRFWTTTDAQGGYSFDGIPAGEYMLRSARHGIYQPARVSARTGTEYADLVMHRNLNMNVEGRVVGSFGEPLEGVTVSPALLGQGSVQTGRDGRFELPLSVRPGVASLTLRFQMAGYQDQSSKIQIGGLYGHG